MAVFYLKKDSKLLFALGKKEFKAGKYNGIGGNVKSNEIPDEAMVRKVKEKMKIIPINYEKSKRGDLID